MSRVWLSGDLETASTFWRVLRRDGIALGFVAHDRDLWFDGVLHRAAPGMTPAAIRRTGGFEPDSAEVQGALSHDAIAEADLLSGRFDGARVLVGLVDWESGEREVLYSGTIGAIAQEAAGFTVELVSRKAELLRDPIPRTSPACRAEFCGPGCNLSAIPYTHEATLGAVDLAANAVTVATPAGPGTLDSGFVRWLDGPQAGMRMNVMALAPSGLVLDTPLDPRLAAGAKLLVREGCDHTLATCADRFANAVNFQGEPFLPGNDQITRYPTPEP